MPDWRLGFIEEAINWRARGVPESSISVFLVAYFLAFLRAETEPNDDDIVRAYRLTVVMQDIGWTPPREHHQERAETP